MTATRIAAKAEPRDLHLTSDHAGGQAVTRRMTLHEHIVPVAFAATSHSRKAMRHDWKFGAPCNQRPQKQRAPQHISMPNETEFPARVAPFFQATGASVDRAFRPTSWSKLWWERNKTRVTKSRRNCSKRGRWRRQG